MGKTCSVCKKVKHERLFHKNKRMKDGLNCLCIDCVLKRAEQYRRNKGIYPKEPHNYDDLVGKRFGKLTVLKHTHFFKYDRRGDKSKSGKIYKSIQYIHYYRCMCDCGHEKTVTRRRLMMGITQSCGCLVTEGNIKRCSLGNGEASFNVVYLAYQHGASKRNLEFQLTRDEFRGLTQGNCVYCGITPQQNHAYDHGTGKYIHNGIDRVDSSRGYISDNCVPCCRECNYAKGKLSQEGFFNLVERIYNHSIVGMNPLSMVEYG